MRAARASDFSKIIVDTIVQEKAVAFPTYARLVHKARQRSVRLWKKHGIELRQSYERVGKPMLIAHQRYAQAKQLKRAAKALRKLRTWLGRVERDILRKIRNNPELRDHVRRPLYLAEGVRLQRPRQPGEKIYSLHAPEEECIGKGKAHRAYEFSVKVSVATSLHRSVGGQFFAHIKSRPGPPYDGHTLANLIPEMEQQLGTTINRIVADRGYRGHNARSTHQLKVYIAGRKRRVTYAIKRELRGRPKVEPVIGHLKEDHRIGRNFLAHAAGDTINAILAAVDYNFRRILSLTEAFLRLVHFARDANELRDLSTQAWEIEFFTPDYRVTPNRVKASENRLVFILSDRDFGPCAIEDFERAFPDDCIFRPMILAVSDVCRAEIFTPVARRLCQQLAR